MPAAPFASRFGKAAGEHDRLLVLVVVGGAEIDSVVAYACQEGGGDFGHPGFGVAHGGGVIAVDVAEIALAFDQRIADGEILGEADQGVVDRGVAMGVELAHDVADDAGAFLEAGRGVQAQLLHGVDQAAVDRFEPVAHVRQAAGHDGGHGVGEVALGQGVAEAGVVYVVWHGRLDSGWRFGVTGGPLRQVAGGPC